MSNINIKGILDKSFDNEIWKPIKGFPDYQVSEKGRVKSLKFGNEKILKSGINGSGYLTVDFFNEGKKQRKLIHRLVSEAFLENPEEKQEVNHKNGIKRDNHIQNLEWVTRSENLKHAFKTGLISNKGINNPGSKLSTNDVFQILNDLNVGFLQREIAARYNVARTTITQIKTGQNWSHLTGITYKKSYSENPAQILDAGSD